MNRNTSPNSISTLYIRKGKENAFKLLNSYSESEHVLDLPEYLATKENISIFLINCYLRLAKNDIIKLKEKKYNGLFSNRFFQYLNNRSIKKCLKDIELDFNKISEMLGALSVYSQKRAELRGKKVGKKNIAYLERKEIMDLYEEYTSINKMLKEIKIFKENNLVKFLPPLE